MFSGFKTKGILVLIFVLSTAFMAYGESVGSYRIPQNVTYAGTPVPAGVYTIEITDGQEGPYLQLSKDGGVVARDLAIVIPATGTAGRPQVQIADLAGQEFLRIRVRSGENWYYAYLEEQ